MRWTSRALQPMRNRAAADDSTEQDIQSVSCFSDIQVFLQRNGVVMFCVVRTVDEDDPAMACGTANLLACLRMAVQLGKIALELGPLFEVVREPPAKRSAGRHILEPGIKPQIGFLDTTRPEPLHQKPNAVFRRRLVINAFQSEHFTPPWLLPATPRADRFLLPHEN